MKQQSKTYNQGIKELIVQGLVVRLTFTEQANQAVPQSGAGNPEEIISPAECGLRGYSGGKESLLSLPRLYKRTGRKG